MARLASLTIVIPANGRLMQKVSGTYLFIKSAQAAFDLRIDGQETLSADVNTEVTEQKPWRDLEFVNRTASPIEVVFFYGDGTVKTNGITFTGSFDLKKAVSRTHSVAVVGLAAVQLLPSNLDRQGWKVVNNGTHPIFLGSSNAVTVANGEPLAAGAAAGWDDQYELWAISGTAGQDVRVTEIE